MCIYGVTFATIHNGHVLAARAFMEQMRLDWLYVIPSFLPPHKSAEPGDVPQMRMKMCELAFSGTDGVVVSDIEIARGGKSYTYDTLTELSSPDTRLFLLCGTDMVLTFDTWYRFEDILKLCYPVYIRRENDPETERRVIEKIGEYYRKYGVMFRKIIAEPFEISSTEIRERVKCGKDISGLVPPAVEEYIARHGLYREDKNDRRAVPQP